jgi:pimeloyl-ACP methyl ester carboxylesterase
VEALSPAYEPLPSDPGGWRHVPSFDGTRIAWRIDGTGSGLPLVLCNGISCDDGYWRALVPALTAGRRVVRWHYRGHGHSEIPPDAAHSTVQAVVRDLVCLLDHLQIPAAVLAGHSFGAQVALAAALEHPGRVRGVAAVAGSASSPYGQGWGAAVFGPLRKLVLALPELSNQAWATLWSAPAAYWVARAVRGTTRLAPREVMADYFTHVSERDLGVLLAMLRSMLEHSAMEELPDLRCPLLAIAGDADALTPLEAMMAMAVRARGELVIVPGGAHTLPAEHPEAVVAHLLPFLARLEAA